jgi:hypothetical protein
MTVIKRHGKTIGEYQGAPKYEGQSPDIFTVMHPKGGQRVELDGATWVFDNKDDADEYVKHNAHDIKMGWATEPMPFWKVN